MCPGGNCRAAGGLFCGEGERDDAELELESDESSEGVSGPFVLNSSPSPVFSSSCADLVLVGVVERLLAEDGDADLECDSD